VQRAETAVLEKMELSVVILNWNAHADTIQCVKAVSAWQHVKPTIWVVDNGSANGSAEVIAHACPDIHLVRNETNLGFGGGNNKGISQALAGGNRPILLLNNDAFVEEHDIGRLLETLQENGRIGFIGPLLYDAEQPDRLLSAGGKDPVLYHHGHIFSLPRDQTVTIVDYVPGTVVIGRAEVFHTVGLLDEAYFFNTEVADLCMRARQHGYLSAIDARARATHMVSRSSPLRETLYTYYVIRNRFHFIPKFHHKFKYILCSIWAAYSVALYVKARASGKVEMARAVRLGLSDGLRGRFGGQNERVLAECSRSTDEAGALG
jgi:GT2 family glycosyltransferase